MTVKRNKILKFCKDYLKVNDFKDYCVNGLQVEGGEDVKKIITGVSFSQELIRRAIENNAEMIIVHHGIFKSTIDELPKITGNLKSRLKLLLENDINLCGFHLPLDAHPAIGNNASLAKVLGLKNLKPFDVGFIGEYQKPIDLDKFISLVDNSLNTNSYVIKAGVKKIKTVGIISGGSSVDFKEAKELGADVYLCGDIHEFLYHEIKEAKINFINAGHYNTEKLGIQNLGKLISKKFNIEVEFIDIPCDI